MEEKLDARTLPREVLEEKRRQAHRLRERGMTRAEIGQIVGVHADTVGRWLKLSPKQLEVNRGGRKTGDGRHLDADQEKYIRRLITDKLPDHRITSYNVCYTKLLRGFQVRYPQHFVHLYTTSHKQN